MGGTETKLTSERTARAKDRELARWGLQTKLAMFSAAVKRF